MSIEYLNLAFRSSISNSSTKFILVALADYANEIGEAYPSIQTLIEKTAQDRKTVIRGLQRLEELGYVTDTGARRGKTRQVKVWQLHLKSDDEKHAKNGIVPKPEQFPISPERVPDLGYGSVSEPSVFYKFWKTYGVEKNRLAAEKAWSALTDADKHAAIYSIPNFFASLPSWQTKPHPAGYLLNRRWEDDLTPPSYSRKKTRGGLPRDDNQLSAFAEQYGLPGARPGENYQQYRARLSAYLNQAQT